MDPSFSQNRFSSVNLNPLGTELVSGNVNKSRTFSAPSSDKIVLSTPEESIQLNMDDFDETLLRNILYCYTFLDTSDKQYVNSVEAELLIRQVRDENPDLFKLLFDVLQVVSENGSSDSNIAKNLFISRLRDHVKALKPDDTSSVLSLKTPVNAVSEYFRYLGGPKDNNPPSSERFNPRVTNDLPPSRHGTAQSHGSLFQYQEDHNQTDDNETVFHPRPVDLSQRTDPDNVPVESVNKFESVNDYMEFLNSSSNVNEFIVFNYNTKFDWQESLREFSTYN